MSRASKSTRYTIAVILAGIVSLFASPVAFAGVHRGVDWDVVARCESGNNWAINTGNGYYGGLQFALPTWYSHGGKGMPNTKTREQQIAVANRVLQTQGIGAWPTCGPRGLR